MSPDLILFITEHMPEGLSPPAFRWVDELPWTRARKLLAKLTGKPYKQQDGMTLGNEVFLRKAWRPAMTVEDTDFYGTYLLFHECGHVVQYHRMGYWTFVWTYLFNGKRRDELEEDATEFGRRLNALWADKKGILFSVETVWEKSERPEKFIKLDVDLGKDDHDH